MLLSILQITCDVVPRWGKPVLLPTTPEDFHVAAAWLRLFSALILALGFVSCADSSSSGGGGGDVNPRTRWPEKGSFEYNFRVNGCRTQQTFDNKADYCLALMDRPLNRGCALEARKSLYEGNCGADFDETNVEAYQTSGYDSYLKRSCETAKPPTRLFPRLAQLCDFLKNESVHQGCLLERRRDAFLANGCKGIFPDRATQPGPTPTPPQGPTPIPTPAPTPQPTPLPQVVQDLIDGGIDVLMPDQWDDQGRTPREPLASVLLPFFLKELELVKNDFLRRRDVIKKIDMSRWTKLDTMKGELDLDLSLKAPEMRQYLELVDRRVAIERSVRIRFDFGIEIYGHESDKTRQLRDWMNTVERMRSQLASLEGAVTLIKLGTYMDYDSRDRELQVKSENFASEVATAAGFLGPVAPFFTFLDQHGLTLEGRFPIEKKSREFTEMVQIIEKERATIETLRAEGFLKAIDISEHSTSTYLWPTDKRLQLALSGKEKELLPQTLRVLFALLDARKAIGVEVEWPHELNNEFREGARRLVTKQFDLKSKAQLIKKIRIGYRSSFSFGTLTIGTNDTMADLEKVIAGIKP